MWEHEWATEPNVLWKENEILETLNYEIDAPARSSGYSCGSIHRQRGKCSRSRPGKLGLNTWRGVALNQRSTKTKRKPLTELHVKGHFTEDRKEQQELQRHCEEVYTDKEETKETPQNKIEYLEKKGGQHFTKEGRIDEISVDLVF